MKYSHIPNFKFLIEHGSSNSEKKDASESGKYKQVAYLCP